MKLLLIRFTVFLSLLIGTLFLSNCTDDKLPEPIPPSFCDTTVTSYNLNIKPIIDNNCAYSGCHLDSPIAPGNFSSYTGLEIFLSTFEERVIIEKDDEEHGMPPFYAPAGRPQDLTEEELELITCWVEAGYPED